MISINSLQKTYNLGKSNSFRALKDINLEINQGELVSIIGKSGSGKSTLLHLMACIDNFEQGEIYIDDVNVHNQKDSVLAEIRNKKIGLVLQDFALINEYTVLENVLIPLNFTNISRKKKKEMAMIALEKTEIKELSNKLSSQLSGGQKQRVAIARAIVNEPKILLADEPTGALDTKTSEVIMDLFLNLNKSGMTVVIITHDINIANYCNRTITITDGQITI